MNKYRSIIDSGIEFKKNNLDEVNLSSFKSELVNNGITFCKTDNNFSETNYINALSSLGKFKLETDTKILSYTYKDILLNVITNKSDTLNSTFLPFSTRSLNLHIENSLNPVNLIPNYLTLLCKKHSSSIVGGDTLIVNMQDIFKNLTNNQLNTLRSSKIILNNGKKLKTNIIEYDKKRDLEFLSFRDFGNFGIDWDVINTKSTKENILSTIRKVYELLYSYENIYSIGWEKGTLFGIDNKKYLHGRSKQFKSGDRHLQRLRII